MQVLYCIVLWFSHLGLLVVQVQVQLHVHVHVRVHVHCACACAGAGAGAGAGRRFAFCPLIASVLPYGLVYCARTA